MTTTGPPPLTPRAREIADAGLALLEAEGAGGLSMRRLAERLGIRAPSIYKHLPDKEALEAAIISLGFELQAEAVAAALDGADDPLTALAQAYRAFAREHPHLYRLMTARELDRGLLTPGVEERAALPVHEAVGGDPDLARAAWAFAHGMTILELDRRFPPDADLDAAWQRGLDAFRSTRPKPRRAR
jgi:AcrR family transcriptional regulator